MAASLPLFGFQKEMSNNMKPTDE